MKIGPGRLGAFLTLLVMISGLFSEARAVAVSVETSGQGKLYGVQWPTEILWRVRRDGGFLDLAADQDLSPIIAAMAPHAGDIAGIGAVDGDDTRLRLETVPGKRFDSAIVEGGRLVFTIAPIAARPHFRVGRHPEFVRLVIEPPLVADVRVDRDGEKLIIATRQALDWQGIERLQGMNPAIDIREAGPRGLVIDTSLPMRVDILDGRLIVIDFEDHPAVLPAQPVLAVDEPPATSTEPPATHQVETAAIAPDEVSQGDAHVSDSHGIDGHVDNGRHGDVDVEASTGDPPPAEAIVDFSGLQRIEMSAAAHAPLGLVAAMVDEVPTLRLDWGVAVPISIFQRDERLWVVGHAISTKIASDAASIRRHLGRFVTKLEQIEHDAATVIVMQTIRSTDLSVTRDGTGWRLAFASAEDGARPSETFIAATDGLLVADGAGHVEITDPVVGDRLLAVLSHQPHAQSNRAWETTDFAVLPAIVGAALIDRTTTLRPRLTDGGLLLERDGGLRIAKPRLISRDRGESALHEQPLASDEPQAESSIDTHAVDLGHTGDTAKAVGGGLDLARFRELGSQPLLAGLRELAGQNIANTPVEQADASLDVARLYLAHGLVPEARTASAVARRHLARQETAAAPLLRSIELVEAAAANFVPPGKAESLAQPEFDSDGEIRAWRTVAAIRAGHWSYDVAELTTAREILRGYPMRLRAALSTEIAAGLLELGQIDAAFVIVDGMEGADLSLLERSRLLLIKGHGFVRDGDIDRGLALLAEAEEAVDFDRRHKLIVDRLGIEIAADRVTPVAAIASVSPLMPFWRGLEDEADLLNSVGGMYLEDRRIDLALQVWRRAADRAPERSAPVIERMRRHFSEFVAGENWDRGPFEALELARAYRELLPPGGEGEKLVLGLAGEVATLGYPELASAMIGQIIGGETNLADQHSWLEFHASLINLAQGDTSGQELPAPDEGADSNLYPPEVQRAMLAQLGLAMAGVDATELLSQPGPRILAPFDSESSAERRLALWQASWDQALVDLAGKETDARALSLAELAEQLPTHLNEPSVASDAETALLAREVESLGAERATIERLTRW